VSAKGEGLTGQDQGGVDQLVKAEDCKTSIGAGNLILLGPKFFQCVLITRRWRAVPRAGVKEWGVRRLPAEM
jgi:hypothetical protein